MKRIEPHDSNEPASPTRPALTPAEAPDAVSRAELGRRSFLLSLGAIALAGCGAGGADGPAASLLSGGTAGATATGTMSGTGASTGPFVHPGLLHTQADFDRMQVKYTTAPWSGSWNILVNNSHASLTYTPHPQTIVYRGYDGTHAENYSTLFNDVAAAYACALRWKISGDINYANKAVQIMNAWSSTLTSIQGTTDAALAAGIYGYEFANAGEIMRTYTGWAAADITSFQNMMRNVFYSINHDFLIRHNGTDITHYWANWDLCQMASIMAIGVLCDDRTLFDEAVTYFQSGAGNGAVAQAVYYIHPGFLGQWQESGRDQGHNTLGIALMGALCEMAWNQSVDLYGYDNNRFLMGAEYVAKANLIQSGTTYYTVPYVPYNNADNVYQGVFSTNSQGNVRPCWALVYNHYVNRKGLAAPYSKMFALQIQPEGGGGNYGPNSGGYDQLGYGTLTCTRDAIAAGAAPSGLKARTPAGQVELSWWGSAYGTSYNVKRATSTSGPWTTIASGITDLLTYTDNPGTGTWYYVVSAMTPGGETADSNRATAKVGKTLHTYLACNEGTGTAVSDASGQGHAGTLTGSAAWGTGKSGSAVALNGSTDYVNLPANLVTDLTDFTVACWVYWNAARTWERIFDFGSGTGRYMFLTPRSGSGGARFAITVDGGHGEQAVSSTTALPTSQWVHVAVTLSGRTATLYVNGAVAGTNSAEFLPPWQLGGTSQNWIGRSQYAADPYFNGRIDEFRIYRGALSAADIAALIASS
ncbi:LamG-like jellyroll fold domain-containing protein [Massilia sp. Root335]|uniref:LamG-like jellyroll fold domain-containing protein n=1 Tax=Massilia sp. Root335 TaxID=1736517 RepID=UPI0009E82540|nr:LamG-like jellyroll fold domain-containing protein [Massilia sp. Root335]